MVFGIMGRLFDGVKCPSRYFNKIVCLEKNLSKRSVINCMHSCDVTAEKGFADIVFHLVQYDSMNNLSDFGIAVIDALRNPKVKDGWNYGNLKVVICNIRIAKTLFFSVTADVLVHDEKTDEVVVSGKNIEFVSHFQNTIRLNVNDKSIRKLPTVAADETPGYKSVGIYYPIDSKNQIIRSLGMTRAGYGEININIDHVRRAMWALCAIISYDYIDRYLEGRRGRFLKSSKQFSCRIKYRVKGKTISGSIDFFTLTENVCPIFSFSQNFKIQMDKPEELYDVKVDWIYKKVMITRVI